MTTEELVALAQIAVKARRDDLAKLAEILFSAEVLGPVLLPGLITAFEVGFATGFIAASDTEEATE